MVRKPLNFTDHAEDMLVERRIERKWVEQTMAQPDAVEPDPRRPGITLAFRRIQERSGRILRVAYAETDDEIRVITTYFDRGRRRKMQEGR
jgi:Domain of unknown function (DUF4258)